MSGEHVMHQSGGRKQASATWLQPTKRVRSECAEESRRFSQAEDGTEDFRRKIEHSLLHKVVDMHILLQQKVLRIR